MSHRALITGMTGFAGGFLAEHLLDQGQPVLGTAPDGGWETASPKELSGRIELVAWDLSTNEGLVDESRRRIEDFRPDCIYHLAAMSVPNECGREKPSNAALQVNVEGTRMVLDLAASLSWRPRVLFISSSHVYAPVTAESPRVRESSRLDPQQGYGRTKLMAEAEVCRAVDKSNCDVVIARSFQHAGPRQDPRMMLSQWARQFALGGQQPVEVYTRDAQIDLSDVRDVVRAYRLLLEHGRTGSVYNVGSGKGCRSGEVLDLLREMADPKRPIVELHPGKKQNHIADIARLVRCTGWQSEISIETTVADTLAWWRRFVADQSVESE